MADETEEKPPRLPRKCRHPNAAVYDEATATVRLRLSNGMDAIVDAEDYVRVKDYRWMSYNCWVVAMTKEGDPVYLHRWIANAKHRQRVHFASTDYYDCRKQNLIYEDGVRTRRQAPPEHKRPGKRGYAMPRIRGQVRQHGFMDRQNANGEITQRGVGPRPLILIEAEEDDS